MNVDENVGDTPRGAKRPLCSKCGQVLAKNQFDKCLWCGEAVPDELKLTDDEKNEFREKQQKQKRDLITKDSKNRIEGQLERSLFG